MSQTWHKFKDPNFCKPLEPIHCQKKSTHKPFQKLKRYLLVPKVYIQNYYLNGKY